MFPHGVGQNPKLTKHKLPVIDDLVTPDLVSRLDNKSNMPQKFNITLTGLQTKARLLSSKSSS